MKSTKFLTEEFRVGSPISTLATAIDQVDINEPEESFLLPIKKPAKLQVSIPPYIPPSVQEEGFEASPRAVRCLFPLHEVLPHAKVSNFEPLSTNLRRTLSDIGSTSFKSKENRTSNSHLGVFPAKKRPGGSNQCEGASKRHSANLGNSFPDYNDLSIEEPLRDSFTVPRSKLFFQSPLKENHPPNTFIASSIFQKPFVKRAEQHVPPILNMPITPPHPGPLELQPLRRTCPLPLSPVAQPRRRKVVSRGNTLLFQPKIVPFFEDVEDGENVSSSCPSISSFPHLNPTMTMSCPTLPTLPTSFSSDLPFHSSNQLGSQSCPTLPSPTCLSSYSEPELSLPTVTSASASTGCSYISADTLSDLMGGLYPQKFTIIDCRFPYEYEGGHIREAINISTQNELEQYFMHGPQREEKSVLIFHCEFSSHRGPSLCRHLRKRDREAHADSYPQLFYPEVYVLDGGYKKFFETSPQFCFPQEYVPMTDDRFSTERRRGLTMVRAQGQKGQVKRSWSTGSIKTMDRL